MVSGLNDWKYVELFFLFATLISYFDYMKGDEISYLANQILHVRKVIENTYNSDVSDFEKYSDYYTYDEHERRYQNIFYYMKRLYKAMIVFLDAKEQFFYRDMFVSKFGKNVADFKLATKVEMDDDGEPSGLTMFGEINNFMFPFKEFDFFKEGGADYLRLMSVLKSTGQIMAKMKNAKQ